MEKIKIGQKVFITNGSCEGKYGVITRFLGNDEYEVLIDTQSIMEIYTIVEIDEFNFVD
jgi:hypothetical protein